MKWQTARASWSTRNDPPPEVPPGQDEYPGVDYPK